MKNKLNFWYMLLGVISIILIFLYFVKQINESIRTVSMSIGASVLGAVILGIIIEKIEKQQVKPFQSIFDYLLCPFECSYPSSILSRIIASGESGMYSVADITFTSLSFSVFLCTAISYLLRLNLSSL